MDLHHHRLGTTHHHIFGHAFVFSILAAIAERGALYIGWVIPLVAIRLVFAIMAFKKLRNANDSQEKEVTGLMQFSFWIIRCNSSQ